MPEPSPLPWSVRDSAVTQQLFIVAADGTIVAAVHANSRGRKMPALRNAQLIVEAVNALGEDEDA